MFSYLIINIVVLLSTLVFSFEKRIQFYKKWKYLIPSLVIVAVPMLLWDQIFTQKGVWGFSEEYLIGLKIGDLPIEEILFFICIPYSCIFIYETVNYLYKNQKHNKQVTLFLFIVSFISIISSITFRDRLYTLSTFSILGITITTLLIITKPRNLIQFFIAFIITLIPFFIVNGILTSGLPVVSDNPIVWYNNDENLGIRLTSIPIEDLFYSFILLFSNFSIYEFLKTKFK